MPHAVDEGNHAQHPRDVRQQELKAKLVGAEMTLERAFCQGTIGADERNGMAAELVELRAAPVSRSLTLPSLEEVVAVSGAFPRLDDLDNRIAASRRNSIEQARNRLEAVPTDASDDDARTIVRKAIAEGYIQTAHEQIARLERGETVTPPPVAEDPYGQFMQHVGDIESGREAQDSADSTIVRRAAKREPIDGVPFDRLSERESQQAVTLLEAWYTLARRRRVETSTLQDVLQHLGFKVRNISTDRWDRGWPIADVATEPIEDRALCPSRQFGSEAAGHYRVLLNWERPADESIGRSIGIEGGYPTVVLHFGCLGSDREKLRTWAIQSHRLFIVIDEALILFLAGLPSRRLSTLFRCTLPYSSIAPYATTSGLVPPELFYGRERDRQAIMDISGACFIYGGRQLGKTALLRRVERDFHRSRETHVAKWIDLKVNEIGYARGPSYIWPLLERDLGALGVIEKRRRQIDPEVPEQVDALVNRIDQWFTERDDRRFILLLDEADEFLVQDAETDFRESARLKGLMDRTKRRFKVVLAGLHNVLRTTRQANHPLAHFGDPICVGAMLSNGEWKQAQALVREPLLAVGCQFDRDDLSTRILAQTNYYPSLIQLYGAELVRRLRDSRKSFPYRIADDDIDEAYASGELRGMIRERFLLTLQLDPRYEVIAYALAFELNEGTNVNQGVERGDILEAVKSWWQDGFELQDIEFNMLLHEMEGLGVLRAIDPDRYTLRNPNVLLLLGGRQDIQKALDKERKLESVYKPASFRARYPGDSVSVTRRGPLTHQQESDLRSSGVAVISGCNAAGLNDVEEFLSKQIERELFQKLPPVADAAEFEQQLRKLRPIRNRLTVYLVQRDVNWDVAWIRTAKRVLNKKTRRSRVAFLATPENLWQVLAGTTESDLKDIDWIELGPWDVTFLRRWLQDHDLTDVENAGKLLEISGGWPAVLDPFSRKKKSKSWKTRIGELEVYRTRFLGHTFTLRGMA